MQGCGAALENLGSCLCFDEVAVVDECRSDGEAVKDNALK
jgi:hypothetical protein